MMSHLSQFRLGTDLSQAQMTNSSKKRRKNNSANAIPVNQSSQDLLPPPLSGYGDTVVASNPFDDCPNTINQMRNGPQMPQSMLPMQVCRPMNLGSPLPSHGSPGPGTAQMSGPVSGPVNSNVHHHHHHHHHHQHPHSNPMMMTNPRMNIMPGSALPGPGQGPSPNPPPPQSQPPHATNNMLMNGGQVTNSSLSMHLNHHHSQQQQQQQQHHHHMNQNNSLGPPNAMMNNNFLMNPMNVSIYQKPIPVNSGKVYPADKPTVFNSQNPNAPPIYPCGVCHKEVHDNDQAILCESGCNFWYHRSCTGLTESAFQLLTAEVYAEWVCDKCLLSKNIPLVKFKS